MIPTAVRGWGRQKPPQGAQIDWTHPLARGLVFANLLGQERGQTLTNSGATFGAGGFGRTASAFASASTQYLYSADTTALRLGANSAGFSIVAVAAWTTVPNSITETQLVSKDSNAASSREYGLSCFGNASYGFYGSVFNTSGSRTDIKSTLQPVAGQRYFLLLTCDRGATTLNLRVDNQTFSTGLTVTPNAGSAAQFRVGARQYSGAESYHNGTIDFVYLFNRPLSTAEQIALYNEPFAMFQRPAGAQFAFSTFNPAWAQRRVVIGEGIY